MEIEIVQAKLSEKEEIWKFLEIAYGQIAKYKYPNQWLWEFVDCPFKINDLLPIWLAKHNGKIIGQTCGTFNPIKIGSITTIMTWSVDTILLPEYRGTGLGSKLQKAGHENNKIYMSLSMSEANRWAKKKCGSKELEPVYLFRKMCNPKPLWIKDFLYYSTRNYKKYRSLVKIGCSIFYVQSFISIIQRIKSALMNRKKRVEKISSFKIYKIDRFDNSIDNFWEKIRNEHHCTIERTSKYLNWKYVDHPNLDYSCFVAQKDDSICGLIIVRNFKENELAISKIVELLCREYDYETFSALLKTAENYLKNDQFYIEYATSVEKFISYIKNHGYKESKRLTPTFYTQSEEVKKENPFIGNGWFFSRGDHDWDYWLPVK